MRNRFIALLLVVAAMAMASLAFGAEKGKKEAEAAKKFTATLSGKEVVPAVETAAKGTAVFTVNEELEGLDYSIDVSKMENVTGAHVHLGKKGTNGPAVLSLLEGSPEGEVEGNLVEGVILEIDLVGPLAGKTLNDLLEVFRKKEAYLMIHSEKHPGGEIRGPIQ